MINFAYFVSAVLPGGNFRHFRFSLLPGIDISTALR